MKRSFPWEDEEIDYDSSSSSSSDSSTPLPTTTTTTNHIPHPPLHITSQDVLIKRAEMYQDYMKQIPIPSHRGSIIPFTSWMGLGRSIKQLYGQPLHYPQAVGPIQNWQQP
ncbi:hypothetical protein Lal_00007720 [Lupinus albus]|uniref:Uncharacterized protein n=1 Tax=Lupinus albus TaxID=3870 RepID=A0A6A4P7I3_LUPAL|nr:putative protein RDM1 [Lupinus albus]KAF1875104.1 hypothetical protein Lal_00007720 [Lupinus albus]